MQLRSVSVYNLLTVRTAFIVAHFYVKVVLKGQVLVVILTVTRSYSSAAGLLQEIPLAVDTER